MQIRKTEFIKLYEHNKKAYEAALSMLQTQGKAAVVHPTGTGKSFIGFKLCEDFPDKTICWLSPSVYIFRTQLENLQAAAEGFVPKNIRFRTYAALMLMDEEELQNLQPDYIVLDEFHRCGASQWGEGVQRLLQMYPHAPVLGLSATAVRYLDNQRDMAEELFEGNIASEMTLGEAIARGILKSPRYVLSIFRYQQDLERLKSKVQKTRTRAAVDAAEQYLEALRRALDKADGLDVVFQKHMQDRTGKYLVFCSDLEHLREMQAHVPEWFRRIDPAPHIYTAYAEDPRTEQAFAQFKKDKSEHLKLLFCIDMLNEGVHVDDVSGVILLRPTVSPVIYKQQIGRALTAASGTEPVIFDLVNNIENLVSIGALEREMQVAVNYYRDLGHPEQIVTERFQIVDETGDARELFGRLQETLDASWNLMFGYARQYFETNGNLAVPRRYRTSDGYALGNWIYVQRKVYAGEQYGQLDEQRIQRLEQIGMVWDSVRDISWQKHLEAAKAYQKAHGNLLVPAKYVTDDGVRLGNWINNLRTWRKSGIQSAYLTEERIRELDALGMAWAVSDYLWEENYFACMQYYREYGDLDVPPGYVTAEGLRIGAWVRKQRKLWREMQIKAVQQQEFRQTCASADASLTQDQIRRLEQIGMIWETRNEKAWRTGYAEATRYYAQQGHLQMPATYVTDTGFHLGEWIYSKRRAGQQKLPAEQVRKLNAIGMVWERPDPWEERYHLAKAYYELHGDLRIPSNHVSEGVWIGKWLNEQKLIRRGRRAGKTLSPSQIRRLDAIGIVW